MLKEFFENGFAEKPSEHRAKTLVFFREKAQHTEQKLGTSSKKTWLSTLGWQRNGAP